MLMKANQELGVMKKGPWSKEEDSKLDQIVSLCGQGRWNYLARAAGLQRTGKSCRLRWMNYLRPNVRHGRFSLEEQLIILRLHLLWGNRWAKIAEQLQGRTDNDIKNYWRSRILKHAKHLNCHVDSPLFKHALRHIWIPMLIDRIKAEYGSMDQAYLPVHSPQDANGPLESGIGLAEPCTEKPNAAGGSVGSNQAQNSGGGIELGPRDWPFVESSPSAWGGYELELGFDVEACEHGNRNDGESMEKMMNDEDTFYLQQQNFHVAI